MEIKQLDRQAKQIAENYRKCEKQLLEIIIELDRKKAFYHFGFNSLFSYITGRLKLTPATAYNFIGVARKSREIPKLKKEILNGNISISKARKIASVINKNNQNQWLQIAREKTQKQIEKEVALAAPKTAIAELIKFVPNDKEIKEKVIAKTTLARIQLQLGVSEKIMLNLRRAQDIESQRLKRPVGLEETLNEVLNIFLSKKDPTQKALRQKIRGKLLNRKDIISDRNKLNERNEIRDRNKLNERNDTNKTTELFSEQFKNQSQKTKRLYIPAKIRHQIQLRDQGQCTYQDQKGRRCPSKRFLEIHHIHPVNLGGGNDIKNLQTLCSGHHKVEHLVLDSSKLII